MPLGSTYFANSCSKRKAICPKANPSAIFLKVFRSFSTFWSCLSRFLTASATFSRVLSHFSNICVKDSNFALMFPSICLIIVSISSSKLLATPSCLSTSSTFFNNCLIFPNKSGVTALLLLFWSNCWFFISDLMTSSSCISRRLLVSMISWVLLIPLKKKGYHFVLHMTIIMWLLLLFIIRMFDESQSVKRRLCAFGCCDMKRTII